MNFATLVALAAGPVMLDAAPPPAERPYKVVIALNVGPSSGVRVAYRLVPADDATDGHRTVWGVQAMAGTQTVDYFVRVAVEKRRD